MVSVEHEVVVGFLRDDPRLLVELLRIACGVEIGGAVDLVDRSASITELAPPEYRADAVLVRRDGARPFEAFVIEVQLQPDSRKRFTWPQYVTGLRARLRCPVTLVVFAPDEATARWCASPIDVGRGRATLCPLVVGPSAVPWIVRAEEAIAWPELAVLSAIAHGSADPPEHAAAVGAAALAAARHLDDRQGTLYSDIVLAVLGVAARTILEAQMRIEGYKFQSDFFRRAFAEGKAEGARDTLLMVLESRGLVPSPDELRRIESCTDAADLETWARKAALVDRVADLFD